MEFDQNLLLTLIAAFATLWMATLSYVAVQHMRQDEVRNDRRKEELGALQAEHNVVVNSIHDTLKEHDKNQTAFRIEMESRLTKIETLILKDRG